MSATQAMRTLIGKLAENGGDQELVHDMLETLGDIEREYVERPKDAAGEIYHVGDRVRYVDPPSVTVGDWIVFGLAEDTVCVRRWGAFEGPVRREPRSLFVHVKPDSWERLFDDIKRKGHAPHTIDEWRKRAIKLAGEA